MQYLEMELAWWFNVGVQIFLCISGFLYGQKDVGEFTGFLSRRFRKILIPYFLAFVPYGILQFFFAKDVFDSVSFIRGLIVNATLTGGGHLWFVSTILMCYVLTPMLAAYRDKYVTGRKSFFLFSLLALIAAAIFFSAFCSFFNPAWMCCYVLGYALGINEKNSYFGSKLLTVLTGAAAVLGNGIQIYCSYIAHIQFKGHTYFYNFNHVLLGVFLFLLLKLVFDSINLEKLNGLLSVTDRYSYEAYLMHHFIILGPFSLMAVTAVLPLNILIVFIGICLLTWLLKAVENIVMAVPKKGA